MATEFDPAARIGFCGTFSGETESNLVEREVGDILVAVPAPARSFLAALVALGSEAFRRS
jgi:hypothetical protein